MTNRLAISRQHSRRRLAPVLVVMLVWLLAAPASAADTEEPRVFRDWKLQCKQPEEAYQKFCQLTQNIVLRENKQPLLHVALGYIPEQRQPGIILTLPLGISLPPGIVLQVDDGEPQRMPIEHCVRGGCRVYLTVDQTLLAAFKAGIEAQVTFHDISRQPVGVPVSLRGFTAGFNALEKPHAVDE